MDDHAAGHQLIEYATSQLEKHHTRARTDGHGLGDGYDGQNTQKTSQHCSAAAQGYTKQYIGRRKANGDEGGGDRFLPLPSACKSPRPVPIAVIGYPYSQPSLHRKPWNIQSHKNYHC